jgi:tetratricopeptide (TPR) repeat protein
LVRQRLNIIGVFALVLGASLAGGCAAAYPPGPDRPTGPESPERPADTPEEPDRYEEEEVAPRSESDARAPTLALLRQSERSADDGDLDAAIAYVERAIRLDPRDATLWLRLARLQLAAQRPTTAEQLAHKAIALAGSQADHKRQGWLLVADALEAQGDDQGAAEVRAQWRTYRG